MSDENQKTNIADERISAVEANPGAVAAAQGECSEIAVAITSAPRKRKRKSKTPDKTADKGMLAVEVKPVAEQDAEQLALYGAVTQIDMNTTTQNQVEAQPSVIAAESSGHDSATETASESLQSEALQSEVPEPVRIPESLGQRLSAARQARGWTREEVASRLRLPVQIVQTLEADHYERIGHAIYLRGYLTNYVRLLDLPTILVENVLRKHSHAEPLIVSGKISHSRYLFQRYSVSALYLILTGVIIVPAVLLAMRANFEPNLAQFAPLDAPVANATNNPSPDLAQTGSAVAVPPEAAPDASTATTVAASKSPAAAPTDVPLIASMAPFSLPRPSDEPKHDAAPAATSGAHTLTLTLSEPSWVEIVAANGEKLEYGLLPAGAKRSYTSDQILDVRLGNSSGAQVDVGGQAQDLAPFRHANVAHFKLLGGGQSISHTDS